MKQSIRITLLLIICLPLITFAQLNKAQLQTILNLTQIDSLTNNFKGIIKWGAAYEITADTLVQHSGKYSMRIEPSLNDTNKQFGCGIFRIPANYAGKAIELSGFIKRENVANGYAGLFMRIDSKTGINQMDNMLNRGINGTRDWRRYSLQLPLSLTDNSIYFGAILSGTGKLWAADFQILIDGKDISEAKIKTAIDTTFDNGSGISSIDLNNSNFDALTVLGKLWGFLKYYHPKVATGDINWDYELFRIIPKVINCNSKEYRNKILLEWIVSFGTIMEKQQEIKFDKGKIKFAPDLIWTEDERELGKDIVAQLNRIKTAKRTTENYYLNFAPGIGNPIFEHEDSYDKMKYPDTGYRLLTLYRYWNIIQYCFPYKNLIKDDWNKVLRDLIPEFIKADNALQYHLTVLKMIEKVSDSHANIWGSDSVMWDYFGKYTAPCNITFIENKAVITQVFSRADSTFPLKTGDIVEKVNSKNLDDIVKSKLPIYPASNYLTKLRNIAKDILRSNSESILVTYKRGGQLQTDSIKCINLEKFYSYSSNSEKKSWKTLENNIGYIYPGSIRNSELPDIMKRFKNDKGIIIDLRCYPSEFIVFSLGAYLMPAPIKFVKFSATNFDMPGLFHFTDALTVGNNNPDYFRGKVVIILNEMTQSQAEYTSMAFRKAPKAIVIGSTTAGADGNVSQFYLPGGISTMISGIGIYYPDGTETQRVGIVPDIEMKPTIKGIIEGRDELLEKAINIINDSN
jgi:hypothetical protein